MTQAVPVSTPVSVGIDVSAAMLDVHLHPLGKALRFANDEAGLKSLCGRLQDHAVKACVFEVTGHYSRALHASLHAAGLPAMPVNPRQASFFIRSHSPSCKTDKSDAKALAAMADALPLRVTPPRSPAAQELYELVMARQDIVAQRIAWTQRQGSAISRRLQAMIEAQLTLIENQVAEIDAALAELAGADPLLKRKIEVIASMPGLGFLTAVTLPALMPELGSLTGKQAAALLGVAPKARDSGTFKGKRSIHGGRASARTALYMPAMTAMRCNPIMKDFANILKTKGKPHKVVRIAVMRKIIVNLNAMLKTNSAWREKQVD